MKPNKKLSALFIDAAARIVNCHQYDRSSVTTGDCCCTAISIAITNGKWNVSKIGVKDLFAIYFKPEIQSTYWWRDPEPSNEDQEARRLALLFMAEIVLDPDQTRYELQT